MALSELTVPGTVAADTAGPTCVELASVEVPAELLAVAKALKKFGTSPDVMVYVPDVLDVEALRGSLVSTGLVPL